MTRVFVALVTLAAFVLVMRAVWWLVREPGVPIEVVAE